MGQIFRYALVGLSLNMAMYGFYLILTAFVISPFKAVFLLYPLGMLVGFYGHRRFTFKLNSDGRDFFYFLKYIFVYILGFLLNLLLMYIFYEKLGYPHQIVQLSAVFIIALFLFLLMRFFVFPAAQDKASRVV
jgi:putative flippase GtrA